MRTFTTTFILSLVIAVGAMGLTGCDTEDLLGTEPFQSVSPEVALQDIEGTRGVLRAAYTRNQQFDLYGNVLILPPELLSDNSISRSGATRWQALSRNEVRSHMAGVWDNAYQQINDANTVLASVEQLNPDNPGVSQEELTRLQGEAQFIRGLAYHNLAKVFGYEPGRAVDGWQQSVILRTEPTQSVEEARDFRARSTISEVYNQIKTDLDNAIDNLSQGDRGSTQFASHAAALALRARVALYESDWSGAEQFATQAMNATSVGLVSASDYVDVSLADPEAGLVSSNITTISSIYDSQPNPESLFEVAVLDQTEAPGGTANNQNDALSAYLLPVQWHANIPPEDFLGLFEESDVRRNLYLLDDEENPGNYYTIKYNQSVAQWTDSVPVIRYPELLLIRAEARYEQGDESGALEDLNTLREARNASEVTASGEDLLDAIMAERRLELAYEGHRWFDQKRRGMDIRKPGGATIDYDDFRILSNLPSADVQLNPELEQNPGY